MSERRILLLITDLEIGGTPTVVRDLAIRLKQHATVEVACLKRRGPIADQISAAGVQVTAFDAARPWHLMRTIRRLRELLRNRQIDTLFSFLIHANFVAARAAVKIPGIRQFQSIQTIQPRPKWHWWLQRRIWRVAEKIIVPSLAIVDVADQRCGIPRDRFVVIPNAVEPSEFGQTNVFAGEVVRIGYLGRLDYQKGPILLPAVLRHLGNASNFELHYFGDGPALRELELERQQDQRIILHGAVARPQDALSQIDVLVLPSRIEGFGLVLIEAMAAGVPTVSISAGGVRDVITNGRNGLLVPNTPDAPRDIADAIRRLRDDESLRQSIIRTGLVAVEDEFCWSRVIEQYFEVLEL